MFPRPAAGQANTRGTPGSGPRGARSAGATAACAACPRRMGELPVAALAEEIDTPGDGQVRALVTIAGNPVLSTPNGGRLDAALAALDFMVSVDIYVNETTRHADVILPAPSAAPEAALRPGAAAAGAAQRRQLVRAGAAARRRPARRVGGPGQAGADRRRAWAPTPTRPAFDDLVIRARVADEHAGHDVRRGGRGDRPPGPGPAGRPHAAHRPLRASTPRRPARRDPHGIDLGPLRAAPARGAAHAERAGRAGARR